jgi:hypothetical protein
VAPKYWLVFGALGLTCACGVITNDVNAAPLLTGLRFYLRALPFFFLPAVCDFSEQQIRQQLRCLMVLGLLQLPVTIDQRWIVFSQGRFSGDDVRGTLLDSGILSIFLICSALVATGMYLRGQLRKGQFYPLLVTLLLPTTINETKVTLIYVPIGFAIVLLAGAAHGHRMKMAAWTVTFLAVFVALFVPIYNYMEIHSPFKKEKNIVAFFSNEQRIDRYLKSDPTAVGTKQDIRRGDAIDVPLAYLEKNPVRLALGLGLGNVSPSTRNRNYEGAYYELFRSFLITSFTYFILELGLFGVGILLILYWIVFKDAVTVSREPGLLGAIALGWIATTLLMCISLAYSVVHMYESVSYLFWYFSGLIAAHRARAELVSAPTSVYLPKPI